MDLRKAEGRVISLHVAIGRGVLMALAVAACSLLVNAMPGS
jgi:hypothetical protein